MENLREIAITSIGTLLMGALLTLVSCENGSNPQESQMGQVPDLIDFNFHVKPILSDRCFACHGPDEEGRKADLRFDVESEAFAALDSVGKRFAIVSGDVNKSELIHRIRHSDPNELMPPPESKLSLTDHEKEILSRWIEQGAEWKPHWSFIPPKKPELPKVKKQRWANSPIDRFVLARMESQGLAPNEAADKPMLLKRLAFDLTGLPPSLALQEQFLHDDSEAAYENMVDILLQSQHYGEHMAVHWLDVARYADSHGYQDDGPRTMWPWRDWVIHAFNENYPYDKFLTWQLAGDLIEKPNKEMLLATGFNRNHKITQEGGVIDEEYRIEYVTDRTNTFSKAFMGLTMECAKCHDHKYDPISQKDYYQAFAFFNMVPEKGLFGTVGRNSYADPPKMEISNEDIEGIFQFINKKDTAKLEVMVMKDSSGIRSTRVLNRGNYDSPTDTVFASMPEAIFAFDSTRFEKNRLGLAKWLLHEKHPLTARVYVNRIWQEIFGRGIVKTSGDFGLQGELPSHPELLDWLAVDFREHGWDIKRLVKQIVMSATYRQSGIVKKVHLNKDPENVFLARSTRFRLGAETVRDHVLATSGLLNRDIGGPSVKTYQAGDIWSVASPGRGLLMNYIQDHGDKLYRRGIYIFVKRTNPPPTLLMFDASNRDQCEVRRLRTNTPLQALAMLNDPHVLEASRVFAENLEMQGLPLEDKVRIAFRTIVCRPAGANELQLLTDYHEEELSRFKEDTDRAYELLQVGEMPLVSAGREIEIAAMMQVIHTIYNMEETITKS